MGALDNNHNVYILGAGFSADRGLPQIWNFMLAMRDAHPWLVENGRTSEAKSIESVLEYRLRAASAGYRVIIELENIEELFSLASASQNNLMPEIRSAIAATLDYCEKVNAAKRTQFAIEKGILNRARNLTYGRSRPNSDGQEMLSMPQYEMYVAGLLGWLESGKVVGRNTFISFNYDTLLEESLSGLGVEFSYGLRSENVTYDSSAEKLLVRDDAMVKVLKLHGSNNWARPSSSQLKVFGNYDDVRGKNEIPELVPPTWRKEFGQELHNVWQEALTAIDSATRVIMLGFSIPVTDVHFKYLLAAGLQDNISLRQIVAVNPDSSLIDSRLSSLLVKSPNAYKRWFVTGNRLGNFINRGNQESQIEWYGRPMHGSIGSFFDDY